VSEAVLDWLAELRKLAANKPWVAATPGTISPMRGRLAACAQVAQ